MGETSASGMESTEEKGSISPQRAVAHLFREIKRDFLKRALERILQLILFATQIFEYYYTI